MYPYITLGLVKVYMTGIGIVVAFLIFIGVVLYLTRKTYQNFWKFFYRLPFFTISIYILGALTTFMLEKGAAPGGAITIFKALSPYGYKFHFVGVLLGILISIVVFLKKITRIENKKARIDILFFAFTLAIVPLGIFLMLGDNFIGMPTDSLVSIQSLHTESQLNKFIAVYPIGLFLSIGALLTALIIRFLKITRKKSGYGLLGFAILLFFINITIVLQQYPRYGAVSIGNLMLDIKQYSSFLVIMRCLYLYNKIIYNQTIEPAPEITKFVE